MYDPQVRALLTALNLVEAAMAKEPDALTPGNWRAADGDQAGLILSDCPCDHWLCNQPPPVGYSGHCVAQISGSKADGLLIAAAKKTAKHRDRLLRACEEAIRQILVPLTGGDRKVVEMLRAAISNEPLEGNDDAERTTRNDRTSGAS